MDWDRELLESAKNGDLSKVKNCLANGADINTIDESGNTSIMYASMNGHLEIVKFLLETHTAKIGIKNNDGKDAIELAKTGEIREHIKRTVKFANMYAPRRAMDSTNKIIEIFGKSQYDNIKSHIKTLYNRNPTLWKERLIEYMIPVLAAINCSFLPSFNRNLMPIYRNKAFEFISYDKQLNEWLSEADYAGHSMTYCVEVAYIMIELCMTEMECAMFIDTEVTKIMSGFYPTF